MRKLLLLLSFAALMVGGWYFASPWLAMKSIVDAAEAGDEAALEERIDFARLREGADSQISDAIDERTQGGGVLERIGGRIASEIAGRVADEAITPRGITNLVTAGALAVPLVPDRFRGQELAWDVERDGFDGFRGVSTWEDGSAGPVMLFERDGLGWDMVGVDLGR